MVRVIEQHPHEDAMSSPLLSTATAADVETSIRGLIDNAIETIKDGSVTAAELESLTAGGAAVLVTVAERARDIHGNPLAGIDKKQIVIDGIKRLLSAIRPYVQTTVIGLISAGSPPWLRLILWAVSFVWDSSIIDRLVDKLPVLVEVTLASLKVLWPAK